MQDLPRLLLALRVVALALSSGQGPQRGERERGVEGHQQPRRPQRVAAEQRQEPRAAGREEGVLAVAHQQPPEVGEALHHQPRQPGVGRLDGRVGPPRRCATWPEGGLARRVEREPHRDAGARLESRPPPHQATLVDHRGRRVEVHLEAAAVAVPGDPAGGPLPRDSLPLGGPPLPDLGHRGQVGRQGDAQRQVDRLLGARGDLDLLHQAIGGQRPVSVDRDRRVVQPPAEPARDVGELLPVGAEHLRPHQVEVAALDRHAELVKQAHVVDEPAGDAGGADLPVRAGQHDRGSGHRHREVVQGRRQVRGHVGGHGATLRGDCRTGQRPC